VRVAHSQPRIFKTLNPHEKEFIEFVLSQYISDGVEELSVEKLPELLKLKYFTLPDAIRMLGSVEGIRELFIGFQKELYVGRGR
jgi:type I restriction enzyme R subunit